MMEIQSMATILESSESTSYEEGSSEEEELEEALSAEELRELSAALAALEASPVGSSEAATHCAALATHARDARRRAALCSLRAFEVAVRPALAAFEAGAVADAASVAALLLARNLCAGREGGQRAVRECGLLTSLANGLPEESSTARGAHAIAAARALTQCLGNALASSEANQAIVWGAAFGSGGWFTRALALERGWCSDGSTVNAVAMCVHGCVSGETHDARERLRALVTDGFILGRLATLCAEHRDDEHRAAEFVMLLCGVVVRRALFAELLCSACGAEWTVADDGAALAELIRGDERGWSRALLPFALSERNANCVHNGLLLVAFQQDAVSGARFQIT